MAEPLPEHAEPAHAEPAQSEVDALLAMVRQRYGARLTAAELAALRVGIEGIVETSRALRAVRLENSDEPMQPFTPYRTEP